MPTGYSQALTLMNVITSGCLALSSMRNEYEVGTDGLCKSSGSPSVLTHLMLTKSLGERHCQRLSSGGG